MASVADKATRLLSTSSAPDDGTTESSSGSAPERRMLPLELTDRDDGDGPTGGQGRETSVLTSAAKAVASAARRASTAVVSAAVGPASPTGSTLPSPATAPSQPCLRKKRVFLGVPCACAIIGGVVLIILMLCTGIPMADHTASPEDPCGFLQLDGTVQFVTCDQTSLCISTDDERKKITMGLANKTAVGECQVIQMTDDTLRHAVKEYFRKRNDEWFEYGPIDMWDTSSVTNMASLFENRNLLMTKDFDADISKWDTSKVTSMEKMFKHAAKFNQDLSGWKTDQVTSMETMFHGAASFNQDLSGWNTGKVTSMQAMFSTATSFNQDLSKWKTDQVTNMEGMFRYATKFNGDLSGWNTEKVTDMSEMFHFAGDFNNGERPLQWNTAQVTDMRNMFDDATNFDQDLSGWTTDQVTDMRGMFNGATKFNQDLSGWSTANCKVTNMENMFVNSGMEKKTQWYPKNEVALTGKAD